MTQCTATSKRTGDRCRANAVTGRTVCRHHGGRSPVGPASPTFKNGRYSRFVPKRMLERYHEAEADGEMLALRAEVALIDGRLMDVLKRVDTGESSRLWAALQAAWRAWELAQGTEDEPAARQQVGALILQGQGDWAAWEDVRSLIRDRQRLVESERKRMVEAQRLIAVDQAMSLMALLIEAVRKHIPDGDALRAISAEFAVLTALDDPGAVDAD